MGKRHKLEEINILTGAACINDNAPEQYRGLSREAARQQIIADLEALGLVSAIEDHKLMVPRGDRSGAIIEPLLTDQWFVEIAPLAAPAIDAVESGAITFVPKQYENTYFAWMRIFRIGASAANNGGGIASRRSMTVITTSMWQPTQPVPALNISLETTSNCTRIKTF